MLLARLPEEARCQQAEDAPVERWDVTRELLAQACDHLVVIASQHKYREIIRVPRPADDGKAAPQRRADTAKPHEVAAFFAKRVRVRS